MPPHHRLPIATFGQLCFLVNAQLDLAVYNLENMQQTGFLRRTQVNNEQP